MIAFNALVCTTRIITATCFINSHAVGMAVARLLGAEIDFVRNPISGSAAWFYVIILKFIFTTIF